MDPSDPPPPPPPAPPSARPGCASWLVAFLLATPAPVVFFWVLGQAEGEAMFDVVGHAGLAALVWLAVPVAFLVVRVVLARARWRALATAAAVAVHAIGVAGWIVRPTAPDGGDHPESLAQGSDQLRSTLTASLDRLAPGEWKVQSDSSTGGGCLDDFGRDQGAESRRLLFQVDGGIDAAALDREVEVLAGEGWVKGPPPRSDAPGFTATRNGYRLGYETRTRTDASGVTTTWTNVDGSTPCLRA
jgi:hypothetical protein